MCYLIFRMHCKKNIYVKKNQQQFFGAFSFIQHIICRVKPKATKLFCHVAKNKAVAGDKYFDNHAVGK